MRTAAPPLAPIFRSRLQGELLAATLFDPALEQSLTDLAKHLRAPVPTVQREVSRLEQAGLLRSRRVGNTRLVSADTTSPLYEPLAELAFLTFGPLRVIEEEMSTITATEEIIIYGSWAARYEGRSGPPPGDIDVLIVGSPDADEVADAATRAENRLRREVNVAVRSPARWKQGDDGFLRHVRSAPRIVVWRRDRAEEQA